MFSVVIGLPHPSTLASLLESIAIYKLLNGVLFERSICSLYQVEAFHYCNWAESPTRTAHHLISWDINLSFGEPILFVWNRPIIYGNLSFKRCSNSNLMLTLLWVPCLFSLYLFDSERSNVSRLLLPFDSTDYLFFNFLVSHICEPVDTHLEWSLLLRKTIMCLNYLYIGLEDAISLDGFLFRGLDFTITGEELYVLTLNISLIRQRTTE